MVVGVVVMVVVSHNVSTTDSIRKLNTLQPSSLSVCSFSLSFTYLVPST